jgi:MFS transporter, DHA1 family, chloramphenicol resistance protein
MRDLVRLWLDAWRIPVPVVLYVLALAVFAQATSEFMLSGLLPDIARELAVSIPEAGALTSAFAVGMIVGAPVMAMLSMRWSRRWTLFGFLAVFLSVHVLGALTSSYPLLMLTRVLAAVSNAGFLAVALAAATSMVAPNAKGRATAILLGGTTVACVLGVPGGALLGQLWGWRSAFWAVAVVSVPALAAIIRSVPARPPRRERYGVDDTRLDVPDVRRELRVLGARRPVTILMLGALVNAATFCAFTYLAPLVTTVAGLEPLWVPVVLALFGLGSFLGVGLGGRMSDRAPGGFLLCGGAILLVGWLVFALVAGNAVALLGLAFGLGVLSFAVGALLISQVLYAAAAAPTLAGGFATAAFNVGAALGPWLGGLAIGAGPGFRAPLLVSAALVFLALLIAAPAASRLRAR